MGLEKTSFQNGAFSFLFFFFFFFFFLVLLLDSFSEEPPVLQLTVLSRWFFVLCVAARCGAFPVFYHIRCLFCVLSGSILAL